MGFVKIFSKPSGIAAFAAQLLGGGSVLETVENCLGTGGGQDCIQLLLEQIAQSQVTLVVQAAGNHGTVAKHTDLIPQTIAENPVRAFLGGQVRPVKFVSVFQIDPVSQPGSSALCSPGLGEELLHGREDLLIFCIGTALIPKAVDGENVPLCCFAERKAAPEIFFKGDRQVVGFKGMQRDVYLMQGRGIKQQLLLL